MKPLALALLLSTAPLAPAAEESRKNVVMIIADDLNSYIQAFGDPVAKTPQLDRLASKSLRFDRAYCQWPVCGPSRASFMTGLYPNQTGVKDLHASLRDKLPDALTIPQHFMKHGYRTARVGKVYHMSNPGGIGTDGLDDPPSWNEKSNPAGVDVAPDVAAQIYIMEPNGSGFRTGAWKNTGGTLSFLSAEGTSADGRDLADPLNHTDGMVATESIKKIREYAAAKQPFFLTAGFFKPHTPFVAPKKYFDLYDPEAFVVPKVPENYFSTLPDATVKMLKRFSGQDRISPENARKVIHAYYATISFLDEQIGRVIAALEDPDGDGDTSDSILDDTIIVMLSDHGFHMGEHNYYQKDTLFDVAARSPLLIRAPGMKSAGASTDSLVELVDLFPTLTDLAGLPAPPGLPGVSLRPVIDDPAATVRDSALSQVRANYTIVSGPYRYSRLGNGGPQNIELYDHRTDPAEMNNLARSAPEEHAETIRNLDALLSKRVSATRGNN